MIQILVLQSREFIQLQICLGGNTDILWVAVAIHFVWILRGTDAVHPVTGLHKELPNSPAMVERSSGSAVRAGGGLLRLLAVVVHPLAHGPAPLVAPVPQPHQRLGGGGVLGDDRPVGLLQVPELSYVHWREDLGRIPGEHIVPALVIDEVSHNVRDGQTQSSREINCGYVNLSIRVANVLPLICVIILASHFLPQT